MIFRLLFIALLTPAALAHDFWIEPSTYRPTAATTFTASLRVGDNFEGDPVPRRSARIVSFVVRDSDGERPVNGFENSDPAGFVRIDKAGTAVIAYRGKPYPHELSRAKFEQFLREEGLTHVRVSGTTQKERFQRFAKAIVHVGDRYSAVGPVGFPFELLLEGEAVRVLHEGKPLANAHVAALSRDGRRLTARSDAEGRVRFNLGPGVWLIKAVHLLPAPPRSGYQWDSLWASLTFEH